MIQNYIAVDTETTGLNPKTDKLIEIGALKVVDGVVTERFSALVNPHRTLTEKVRELTGIRQEEVETAGELEPIFQQFLDFAGELPLLGHRILFDYSFLKQVAVNQRLEFERQGIDTFSISRKLMPPERKKNLLEACRYFGVTPKLSHRALADAEAAHLLYQKMLLQKTEENSSMFEAKPLIYKVKREQTATKRQKQLLQDLLKYHRIDLPVQIEYLSRNEVSRWTDQIISQYGRKK
ncbi:MAG: 3'-5' exonuclease [bacterium]|nr:3'-5' exonuclease [bacterium]